MKTDKVSVAIGFVIVVSIWSTTWFVIKIGLESIPPVFGVALRFTLGSILLSIIMFIRKERLLLDRASIALYAMLGVLSFSIPFVLLYWGELLVPTGLTSILFAAYPFAVAIASQLLLPHEKLNIFKGTGIALGLLGLIVIYWEDLHPGSADMWAMSAIVFSAAIQGTSLVLVKKYGHHISPLGLNLGGMLFGIAILYPLAFMTENVSSLRFDLAGIGSILYLGIFGTVIAFVVYYWLLKHVEAVYLSLISFITPIFAVILGVLLLHEKFSPRVFTGAGFILCGILFANGKDIRQAFMRQR